MTGVRDYSTTAAANLSVAGISLAEGMARDSVNNAMRATMADTASLLLDFGGETATTGSSNAFLLTLPSAPTAYADNLFFLCKLNHSVTGPATININGLGVKAFKKLVDGVATPLATGDGPAGHRTSCIYSSADNAVLMLIAPTATVSDEAYDPTTWDGITTVAPSKNAVRDKFESFSASESVLVIDHYPDGMTPDLDGSTDPLSNHYASLAAAQAVYPFITALTQETDYAAARSAANEAFGYDDGTAAATPHFSSYWLNKRLKFPPGYLQFGWDTLTIRGLKSGVIEGDGKFVTMLYAKGTVLAFDGIWYTKIRDMGFTSSPPQRTINTAYTVGQHIVMWYNDLFDVWQDQTFQCTVAGTTSGTANTSIDWTCAIGGTIVDGGVTWTRVRKETLKIDGRLTTITSIGQTQGVQKVHLDNVYISGGNTGVVLDYCFTVCRLGVNAQGSECVFTGIDLAGSSESHYLQSGFNALGNVFIGGDAQYAQKYGLQADTGTFSVYGMDFEPIVIDNQWANAGWDIRVGGAGVNQPVIVAGCRTEGMRFFSNGGNAIAHVVSVSSNVAMQQSPDPGLWLASEVYRKGHLIAVGDPVTLAAPYRIFISTQAGTSDTVVPTWPAYDGDWPGEAVTEVTDGTVKWKQVAWYWIENKNGKTGIHHTNTNGLARSTFSDYRAMTVITTAGSHKIHEPGVYLVNTSVAGGNVTILPQPFDGSASYNGQDYIIRKVSVDDYTVTIDGIIDAAGGISGYGNNVVLPGGARNWVRLINCFNPGAGGSNAWMVMGSSFMGFEPYSAGGTVTQITSKATGVTLDKICGAITMHNASLAAATAVSFTFTNFRIAAADIVLLSIASGATAGAYNVAADAVAAGSCRISLYNRTAGPLGEAVVINFAIIKGTTLTAA